MLLHHHLDKPVPAARGQRIETRDGRALRHDAQKVPGLKAGDSPPVEARPKPRPRQREAQDRGRGLHICPMVAARDQGQAFRLGPRGMMVKLKRQPDRRAKRPAPARKVLRRLAVYRVHRQKYPPTLVAGGGLYLCREGAEGGKAAVAKAQNGHGGVGCLFQSGEGVQEPLGRGGRVAVAIGGGKEQVAFGTRVPCRVEARHRRHAHRLPGGLQRLRQRRREPPGAAAFRADEDHRLGPTRRRILRNPGSPAPPGGPDHDPGHAHHGKAQRDQAKDQAKNRRALAGVQHVDDFRYPLPRCLIRPADQRAGPLVDQPGAGVGVQREDILRVIREGKAQLAQGIDRHVAQRRHLIKRKSRLAADGGGRGRRGGVVGQQVEGRRRHPKCRGCGQ